MDCACLEIDVDYCGEVLAEKTPKARKKHICFECGRTIEPGETYDLKKMVYDGRVETFKTCRDCNNLRDIFMCGGWFFGEVRGDIAEHIRECQGEISEECISELTENGRAFVCSVIEEGWED